MSGTGLDISFTTGTRGLMIDEKSHSASAHACMHTEIHANWGFQKRGWIRSIPFFISLAVNLLANVLTLGDVIHDTDI